MTIKLLLLNSINNQAQATTAVGYKVIIEESRFDFNRHKYKYRLDTMQLGPTQLVPPKISNLLF